MNNQSTNTVEVNLPKIPKMLADYLGWAEQQNEFMIYDISKTENIEAYYSSLSTHNPEEEIQLREYILNNNKKVARAFLDGYLLDHRNYIEVIEEMHWENSPKELIPDQVIFLGKEPRAYDSFEGLQKLYHIEHNEHISMLEVLLNTIDNDDEQEEFYTEFMELYPDYKEILINFSDIAKKLTVELFELVIPNNIERMFNKNNFNIGTVGQSNWSYYVTHKKHNNHSQILDIWEGWNFYTIKLLEVNNDNLFIGYTEEVHYIYAPSIDDLFISIYDHFGLNQSEIALIENDVTELITGVKKLTVREEIYIEDEVNL